MPKGRAMVLELPMQEKADERHPLAPEAQAENLRSAWEHYQSAKAFNAGDLCRERRGLGIFVDDPVLLFARKLNLDNESDNEIALDCLRNRLMNKVDCIIMRVHETGGCSFFAYDSDLLEPWAR